MRYQENPAEIEQKVQEIYNLLKEISQVEDYPALSSNAKRALGTVWQMVNHLGLEYEQPDNLLTGQ